MTTSIETPTEAELKSVLGSAFKTWTEILGRAGAACSPIATTWKPSKSPFGRMCLLQHKKRTLLYLTPDKSQIWVAIVLGERALQLAMAAGLPDSIKRLFEEAKPYAEGRGIRFSVDGLEEIPIVVKLLEAKTANPSKPPAIRT
jgi:hypothetical protein